MNSTTQRMAAFACVAVWALIPQCALAADASGAAASLEQQLRTSKTASTNLQVPLTDTSEILDGEASLEPAGDGGSLNCRLTLVLTHNQPFERRGLRITHFSRRAVETGPCHGISGRLPLLAQTTAKVMAGQIHAEPAIEVAETQAQPSPAAPLAAKTAAQEPPATSPWVQLTVRERAVIRDTPSTDGEKLSRAPAGTQLKGQRTAPGSDWYALDGGMRFINASLVNEAPLTSKPPPSPHPQQEKGVITLRVTEKAVLRDKPSFKSAKVAQLAAGTQRKAKAVASAKGWYQLLDTHNHRTLYIHESVVQPSRGEKRH